MRDFVCLLTAAAALLLAACGSNRPKAQTTPPAAAVSSPGLPISTALSSQGVVISTMAVVPAVVVSTLPVPNPIPHEPQPPISADSNFVLIVSEAVGSPEQDLGSYTKVFIDEKPAGQTQAAPKSTDKKWGAKLEPGNHPVRCEKWNQPMFGDWAALGAQWQPNERFIRVRPNERTIARLKFYDGGRGYSLDVEYQPLSSPLP